jgi:GNAT acetyltransferase-like protein
VCACFEQRSEFRKTAEDLEGAFSRIAKSNGTTGAMNSARLDPKSRSTFQTKCQPKRVSADASSLQETGHETLSVRVSSTWQAVEALRSVWQPWTTGLYTDIDYYLQNLKSDRTIIRPHVVSVWKGDTPLAILAGQVRRRKASAMVSMIRIEGPRVRVLEIVTKGRLGPPSSYVDGLLVLQLSKALREDNVDLLCFHRLPLESQLFQKIWNLPGLQVWKRVPHVFSYSVLPLTAPAGKRPAVFSGKIMREARRKALNLQRAFPGKVRLRCFSQGQELNEGLREAQKVNVAAWQHYLGSGFIDTLHTLEGYRFFEKKGWLRIYILYVAERPCAFLLGQLYRTTFHCQHAGYHADFAKFSAGSVLTAWAFENLAATGAQQVDLGEGGQEHNRRLGCEKFDEGTVHVYSPTLRGLGLNLFFAATQIVRSSGRKTRSSLQLERANRAWHKFVLSRWQVRQTKLKSSLSSVPRGMKLWPSRFGDIPDKAGLPR